MLNSAAQSCRLFGYKPENESNFSFCHYKYFSANGTDFLQLWLSRGPLSEFFKNTTKQKKRMKNKKGAGKEISISNQLIFFS